MDFAARVNQVARELAADSRTQKVLISAVWLEMDAPHWETFQCDLLRAMRDGSVELARADLRLDVDVEDSKVVHPLTGAEYNYVVAPRQNPAPDEVDVEDEIEMYRRFHRLEPREIGEFPGGELPLPARVHRLGKALHVLYRSSKVDPETLTRPRKPVNYIHEHDAGVCLYKPVGAAAIGVERSFVGVEKVVDVPKDFIAAPGLVLLGDCLGLKYKNDRGEFELESRGRVPELYTIASGKLLVVVQNKREILYLVWGGGLGVEGRGIVG